MGMIEKAMTRRTVAPLEAQIGPWFAETAREFGFLTPGELQGLIATRAIAAVDTGKAKSNAITATGKVSSSTPSYETKSLLRAKGGLKGGPLISCGGQHWSEGFVADWDLRMTLAEGGTAMLETSGYRTVDGALMNKGLFTSAREAATAVLANGISLHLAAGPPAVDMVEMLPVPAAGFLAADSPLEHDYVDSVPAGLSTPLVLGAGDVTALAGAFDRSNYPHTGEVDGALRTAPLAGGRPGDWGSVRLNRAGDGGELVVQLPAHLPPVEAQRSSRAALLLVSNLGFLVRDERPALTETISTHLEQVMAPHLAQDRNLLWQPRWSKEAAAPSVRLAAGRWLPVGVLVQTTTAHNYFSYAVTAQSWVSLAKRTAPGLRGLRRETRMKNQEFRVRRPGILTTKEGNQIPYFRYGTHPDCRDHVTTTFPRELGWFWEAEVRELIGPDGASTGGLMVATGASQSAGFLAYWAELLAFLQAFAEVMAAADPGAQISTLYLAL